MNTYERAINEYESENEDGRYKLVYAYFGLAIYHSQCLEESFTIMLWTDKIIKNKVKTNKEVNEIIDIIENSKKTMGNLINDVKQSYNLPDKLIEDLESILDKRNYLVHKYFKLEIQKTYSDLGKKEILKYFSDFIDESKRIDETLKVYYLEYTKRFGITEEKANQLMQEMINEELEREKSKKTI